MKSKLLILAISILCTLQLSAKINKEQTSKSAPVDTLWFEDGSRYIGSIKDSLFNGYGIMLYSDSTCYEGEWKDGLWNGNGFLKFPGGDTYKGAFVNHKMEGEGTYSYSNGAKYEGNWKNNMFDGVGTLEYSDGGYYSGEWKEDKRNGTGVMYSVPDSALYYGEFENDIFIGNQAKDANRNDNLWKESKYYPKVNVSVTYGSNSLIGFSVSVDKKNSFWGGTISINTKKYCRGEDAKYYDEDGKLVILAGWNEYGIDEISEGKYTLINCMVNRGWRITDKWDFGLSAGLGINQKYKNCRAKDNVDSCQEFDIGEFYNKTKFGGLCLSYGIFTRYYIPYKDNLDFLINLGIGNIEGVNFGMGLRF
jgi:hypothetical protein